MKLCKVIVIMSALMMLAIPAWSGNFAEFDAVGDDSQNVFALTNSLQYGQVINRNIDFNFVPINLFSDFIGFPYQGPFALQEEFLTTAGQLKRDPCFGFGLDNELGYQSALTDAWNEAVYEWKIVLQMKPESDIDLNIYDCVIKHNGVTPFNQDPWFDGVFEQTGRYRAPWGQLMFTPVQNPLVTVQAWPGDYATPGFDSPFTMDARTLPGLTPVAMDQQLYTSKALWAEGIVLVMPETGVQNQSGQSMYALKQGDVIQVQIAIPPQPTDIRYGADNVILKYIGIVGTDYTRGLVAAQ